MTWGALGLKKKVIFLLFYREGQFSFFLLFISEATVGQKGHSLIGLLTNPRGSLIKRGISYKVTFMTQGRGGVNQIVTLHYKGGEWRSHSFKNYDIICEQPL